MHVAISTHHRRIFAFTFVLAGCILVALLGPTRHFSALAADPQVTLSVTPSTTNSSGTVQVTAVVDNIAGDLPLDDLSASLTLPPDTTLVGGTNPFLDDEVGVGEIATSIWDVEITAPGDKSFSVAASGSIDGDPFSGADEATLTVDSTAPAVSVVSLPTFTDVSSPTFNWSAIDTQSPVAGYDVDAAIDQGGWVSQLTNSSQTSLTLTAGEGQLVRIRVRATDDLGNTSPWIEASTTIDAIPPVVSFGPPDNSVRGTVKVQVFLTNAGSPVTGRFTFADTDGGRTGVVANGQYVSYKNTTSKQIQAFLRATATDALGRSATGTQAYPVQTRLAPNGMRVLSLSRVGKYVKITGATQKTYNGKVTFSATRVGSKGTKKASKRVRVKKGRFAIKLRVADGRYKFTVSAGSTSVYAASSISKKLTVR